MSDAICAEQHQLQWRSSRAGSTRETSYRQLYAVYDRPLQRDFNTPHVISTASLRRTRGCTSETRTMAQELPPHAEQDCSASACLPEVSIAEERALQDQFLDPYYAMQICLIELLGDGDIQYRRSRDPWQMSHDRANQLALMCIGTPCKVAEWLMTTETNSNGRPKHPQKSTTSTPHTALNNIRT
jgi:hypothetical protein